MYFVVLVWLTTVLACSLKSSISFARQTSVLLVKYDPDSEVEHLSQPALPLPLSPSLSLLGLRRGGINEQKNVCAFLTILGRNAYVSIGDWQK